MAFQAKLITKLDKYSVDNTIVELKNTVDSEELNNIVKSLLKRLKKVEDVSELDGKTFDFVVGGRFLRLDVEKHLDLYSDEIDAKEILSEKIVEVEYLLSLEAPKPLDQFPQDDWISCVDANDLYIISGSYDNSIRIYTIKDRKNIVTIQDAHTKPVTRVKWIKNGSDQNKKSNELYFVSAGHDEVSMLRKLNIKTLKSEVLNTFVGHNRSVNCIDCNDNLIATGSFDKTLRLWSTTPHGDKAKGDEENDENDYDEENKSKSTNAKKKQKVKTNEKPVSKFKKNAIMTLTGHTESITGVKWLGSCNEYNSLATSSMDRSICIWDVEVGECKRRVLSSKPLLGLDYSSENNLLLSASCDRHVRIWDARAPDNATAKTAYTSHNAWVSSVSFCSQNSNSNNFISGGYDNLVKLWDLRSPKACLYDMIGHHDKVLDVNWNNSKLVVSGSADSTIKLFQM